MGAAQAASELPLGQPSISARGYDHTFVGKVEGGWRHLDVIDDNLPTGSLLRYCCARVRSHPD
jgi:hypothetical protein